MTPLPLSVIPVVLALNVAALEAKRSRRAIRRGLMYRQRRQLLQRGRPAYGWARCIRLARRLRRDRVCVIWFRERSRPSDGPVHYRVCDRLIASAPSRGDVIWHFRRGQRAPSTARARRWTGPGVVRSGAAHLRDAKRR